MADGRKLNAESCAIALCCRSMGRKKSVETAVDASDQALRDQEVLRANRELAAYFKGRRTEREARAALKIIKAFVRDRERRPPKSRPPLPGAARASASAGPRPPKRARARSTAPRKPRRSVIAAVPAAATSEPPPSDA